MADEKSAVIDIDASSTWLVTHNFASLKNSEMGPLYLLSLNLFSVFPVLVIHHRIGCTNETLLVGDAMED